MKLKYSLIIIPIALIAWSLIPATPEIVQVCTWESLKFGHCAYSSVQTSLLNNLQLFVIGAFLIFPCLVAYMYGYWTIARYHVDSIPAIDSVVSGPIGDCVLDRSGSSQMGF